MSASDRVVFEGDTELEHYQVIDTVYDGRPARVLYSGRRAAAQSGVAKDDKPDLLFDYNQRFFELASGLRPKKLLLIGGGVYTLPMTLLKAFSNIQIDVVELDPGLDKIARDFFDLRLDERLKIMHGDGLEYLDASDETYDIVLIDAFVNLQIPESLSTAPAAKALASRLTKDGTVAMNIISAYKGARTDIIQKQYFNFDKVFKFVEVFPASSGLFSLWLPQNLVLIGQKGHAEPPGPYMRYGALPPPE